ncbi:MAG: thiamine phosphate synthase [Desulfuromonadaceae bacterium]|nr:thiamine phosphate synthase [Desulfuromonadaceae bacterium]
MSTPLPSLYLITDRQLLPTGRQLLEVLEELLNAGVTMIQLREKDLTAAELFPLARDLRDLTRRHACLLLINDRIDLALAIDADGVHLGGHSLPVAIARNLLGPEKLIGVSTHSPAEVPAAAEQGADFVTFGPVYNTPSKAAYGQPVGLSNLKQACHIGSIPVYALGGVKAENTTKILDCGAFGVAMISALIAAKSPTKACQKFLQLLDK